MSMMSSNTYNMILCWCHRLENKYFERTYVPIYNKLLYCRTWCDDVLKKKSFLCVMYEWLRFVQKIFFLYILWLLMYYLRKYTEWCSDAPSAIFSSTVRHYGSRSIKNSRQKLNDTKTYVITYVELQSGKLINKM